MCFQGCWEPTPLAPPAPPIPTIVPAPAAPSTAAWEGGLDTVGAVVAPPFFFSAIVEDDEVGTHTTKKLICDTHHPCLARPKCRGKQRSMGWNGPLCDLAQGTCMGQRGGFQ